MPTKATMTKRYVPTASDSDPRKGVFGVENLDIPNKTGGYDNVTELKAGRLGKVDVPTGKIARYGKQLAQAGKTVFKAGAAVAAEPFTNSRLNAELKAPVVTRVQGPSGRSTYVTKN